jgi:hypothetical protein
VTGDERQIHGDEEPREGLKRELKAPGERPDLQAVPPDLQAYSTLLSKPF